MKNSVFNLHQTHDGRFNDHTIISRIVASDIKTATRISDRYTKGQFSKNPDFFLLEESSDVVLIENFFQKIINKLFGY